MRVLVDRRGWLQKKGRIIRNWKRRLVTLRPGELLYFADEECKVQRGSMALAGCQVLVEAEEPRHRSRRCASAHCVSFSRNFALGAVGDRDLGIACHLPVTALCRFGLRMCLGNTHTRRAAKSVTTLRPPK